MLSSSPLRSRFGRIKMDQILFSLGRRPRLLLALILLGLPFFPSSAQGEYSLLSRLIIDYNIRALSSSLTEGSYHGEEGILRILPEAARSLGMKVLINEDYKAAKSQLKRAQTALERAKKHMSSNRNELAPGYHTRRILEEFLRYRESIESARARFLSYRQKLNPGVDDRLNREIAAKAMEKLFQRCLKETGYSLRDALGRFFNFCLEPGDKQATLTTENISFVNEIFRRYVATAPPELLAGLDLDRDLDHADPIKPRPWKRLLKREGFAFASELESAFEKFKDREHPVDPLLFLALMRRESRFDPRAVSSVGAVGLTQIMHQTARRLGMKSLFVPPYLDKALDLHRKARRQRQQAMEALFMIHTGDDLRHAREARNLMQRSLELEKKKDRLFKKYRHELLDGKKDDRLVPSRAIEFGLMYFSRLLRAQEGDISLALASYNAGPHRVKEYGGIPPFAETVHFRNQVLRYYREYLQKMKGLM